jgi:hypothetical protein
VLAIGRTGLLGLLARALIAGRLALGRIFGRLQVHSGGLAAAVLLEVVGDALILAQGTHARTLDSSDVHESVGAAFIGLDETIALVFIEKFYGADWHFFLPSVVGAEDDALPC